MNAPALRPLTFRPIDDVEASLIESWRGVSQATHRFLVLLREFDLRQGWKAYGNNDCAEWLDWKCGISRVTAQEKVRMARVLWGLPQIEAAFARGVLSYSKVRALCRVATERNETDLLDYALHASAAQLEDRCRRLRNGDSDVSAADARRLHERRWLSRSVREDGSGTLMVELPKAELDLVLAALEAVAKTLPDDPTRSIFATGADALVRMAETTLRGEAAECGSDRPATARTPVEVVVHIDATALSGQGGQADLPLPVIRRLCCDGAVVPLMQDASGKTLDVGRRQRTVSTPLKRALVARDRGCTFPGCHHTKYLDAHHVEHWAEGGETHLGNLVTLCTTHHRLVHEAGFSIQRNGDGTYYFVRPDGRPVDIIRTVHRGEEERPPYLAVLSSPSAASAGRSLSTFLPEIIAETRSSRGSRRRSASSSRKQAATAAVARFGGSMPSWPESGSSSSARSVDQRGKSSRRPFGTPSSSAIKVAGSGRARSRTTSISPRAAQRSSSRAAAARSDRDRGARPDARGGRVRPRARRRAWRHRWR